MPEICSKCGLPKEICACDILDKEEVQKIVVYSKAEKFKKWVTIIQGLTGTKAEEVTKELKTTLACGGTHKEGKVILQGNHLKKIKEMLVKLGYPAESIQVKG